MGNQRGFWGEISVSGKGRRSWVIARGGPVGTEAVLWEVRSIYTCMNAVCAGCFSSFTED